MKYQKEKHHTKLSRNSQSTIIVTKNNNKTISESAKAFLHEEKLYSLSELFTLAEDGVLSNFYELGNADTFKNIKKLLEGHTAKSAILRMNIILDMETYMKNYKQDTNIDHAHAETLLDMMKKHIAQYKEPIFKESFFETFNTEKRNIVELIGKYLDAKTGKKVNALTDSDKNYVAKTMFKAIITSKTERVIVNPLRLAVKNYREHHREIIQEFLKVFFKEQYNNIVDCVNNYIIGNITPFPQKYTYFFIYSSYLDYMKDKSSSLFNDAQIAQLKNYFDEQQILLHQRKANPD